MTNLELVHYDAQNEDNSGIVFRRKILAVSTSHAALVNFVKETFDDVIGVVNDNPCSGYYAIEQSNILIVPDKINI